MKTLVHRKSLRFWQIVLFYVITLAAALTVALAQSAKAAAPNREFWVWDLRVMPPDFRRAHVTLRAEGKRSLIYVEDKFWGSEIKPDYVDRLMMQLESAVPADSFFSGVGIVPLQEKIFGPLPRKISADDRVIVLFADLGQFKEIQFDGFYNSFDQLTEAEAFAKYKQHSNEANIIYMNGLRGNETYTTGVVAHELQHLLAAGSVELSSENWLSEMLAEGAMLLSGFFTDQEHVNRFVADTAKVPLVTPTYVHYGPQLLFSSFLLDSLSLRDGTAIGRLNAIQADGRKAVEQVFEQESKTRLSFDVIFSNFISYVFFHSQHGSSLPTAWNHRAGIRIPKIQPYFTFTDPSGEFAGTLAPYSFAAIDLQQELSSGAVIQVERQYSTTPSPPPDSCAAKASVLWKPVHSKRIAVYSVGCEPGEKREEVHFRVKILDHLSLLPASPLKLLP